MFERARKALEVIVYYLSVIPTWTRLTVHNTWGIINVFFITWVRPMKGGLIDENHPFATAINPETNDLIWHDNVIFKTERDKDYQHTDREIIELVGGHMLKMVQKSMSTEDNPEGVPDRMPPAINYIHGTVHYNGAFLIFNNIKEATRYYSDPEFKKEFKRFVKTEKREPVTILRERNYDRKEFLEFVCFLRTMFPWFSNSNGNKKRIGWGNPAPYCSVNTITGYWMDGTYATYTEEGRQNMARPAIKTKYFQGEYGFGRDYTRWPEKFLASFTDDRVKARGLKGNMFFVDNRKLLQGYKFNPEALPNILDRLSEKVNIGKVAKSI